MCGDELRCGGCGLPAWEDSDISEKSSQECGGGGHVS